LVEFGVLGPLWVGSGDVVLPAKQRIVLAVLLLRANRVAPVEMLVDAVWGDAPPSSARTTLQGYVKQLRRSIEVPAGGRVITRSPGYLIRMADGELDLDRFTGMCDRARDAVAKGDWHGAAGLSGQALAFWRGDPLADVPSVALQRTEVPRLAELRMWAVEFRVEAELQLGRHGELVAELRRLAGGEPLREGLHRQLMLALYRCGRQGEALEVFRSIDRRLRSELGISPGPELQELHQRILAADPSLAWNPPPGVDLQAARPATLTDGPPHPRPTDRPVEPAQLPPDTADFTGRGEQVKLLCDLLAAPPDPGRPGAVVISAVGGMGGIGKTALAVHVAHQVRDRFPGGQLYVSLQGATSPLRPAEVLSRLLRDLGDLDEAIPAAEEERAARYRSLLADREMLIVLDDARDAAQVRPLLPGSAGCAVIVTSRGMLSGLAGAIQLRLDALGPRDASDLFAAIIGPPRATAEPEATAAVLASCAGLPLAIRIVASRLASRPAWTITHLAARLTSERDRLAELAAGDLAVQASFAVSYHALAADGPAARGSPDAADPARVFRLLGLPAMTELSLPAIAALAGQQPAKIAPALEILTDTCLLQSPAPDRYRLHDLLRTYAASLTASTDSPQEQDAALSRILGWYARQATTARLALSPAIRFPVVMPVPDAQDTLNAPDQAFAWFEAEMAGLVAAARQAAALNRHRISAQIGTAMLEFLHRTPFYDTWLTVSETGVASARHLGNGVVLSFLLVSLGQASSELYRFADADRCFTEALKILQQTGEKAGEATALNCLAINLCRSGRDEDQALEHMRSALDILATVDDPSMTGTVLNNTAHILRSMKRYDEALEHLERAQKIQQDDEFRRGITETTLGQVYLEMGRCEEAARHCRQGLALLNGISLANRNRAHTLHIFGIALDELSRTGEAHEALSAALHILDQLGDPEAAEVRDRLNGLA
jgi:DNA-binding SARP family transcriptional activator